MGIISHSLMGLFYVKCSISYELYMDYLHLLVVFDTFSQTKEKIMFQTIKCFEGIIYYELSYF